jgi:hypothetical protein
MRNAGTPVPKEWREILLAEEDDEAVKAAMQQ